MPREERDRKEKQRRSYTQKLSSCCSILQGLARMQMSSHQDKGIKQKNSFSDFLMKGQKAKMKFDKTPKRD